MVLYAPGIVWKRSGPSLQRGLGRRRNEEQPGRKGLIRRENKEPEVGKIKRICRDQIFWFQWEGRGEVKIQFVQ